MAIVTVTPPTIQTTEGLLIGYQVLWTSPTALTAGFIIRVSAHEAATGDKGTWWLAAARSDQNNTVITTNQAVYKDAGASAWVILAQDDGADALEILVRGENSHTIDWSAMIEYWD